MRQPNPGFEGYGDKKAYEHSKPSFHGRGDKENWILDGETADGKNIQEKRTGEYERRLARFKKKEVSAINHSTFVAEKGDTLYEIFKDELGVGMNEYTAFLVLVNLNRNGFNVDKLIPGDRFSIDEEGTFHFERDGQETVIANVMKTEVGGRDVVEGKRKGAKKKSPERDIVEGKRKLRTPPEVPEVGVEFPQRGPAAPIKSETVAEVKNKSQHDIYNAEPGDFFKYHDIDGTQIVIFDKYRDGSRDAAHVRFWDGEKGAFVVNKDKVRRATSDLRKLDAGEQKDFAEKKFAAEEKNYEALLGVEKRLLIGKYNRSEKMANDATLWGMATGRVFVPADNVRAFITLTELGGFQPVAILEKMTLEGNHHGVSEHVYHVVTQGGIEGYMNAKAVDRISSKKAGVRLVDAFEAKK